MLVWYVPLHLDLLEDSDLIAETCSRVQAYIWLLISVICMCWYIWIIREEMHGMNNVKITRESRQMWAMYTITYIYLLNLPYYDIQNVPTKVSLIFRHRASCILGQAFHCFSENAFYVFNQQIYFIIWYLLDRASLI